MNEIVESKFGFWKSVVYTIIIAAVLLFIAEMSIRVWAYFFRGEYERYDVASETFVLIPGEHERGGSTLKVNRDGFVGNELKKRHDKLFRILAIGDSCTFGAGDTYTTYPALLETRLQNTSERTLEYEVINGGVEGLNSEMALKRLKAKGPDLYPNVVTIYIGWNDLMKFDPTSQGNVKKWAGLARALDKLWLIKGMRKLAFYHIRPNLAPPGVGEKSRMGYFEDFTPSYYEENLRKLIDTVRSMGAKPVVMTLPTVVRSDMTLDNVKEANVVFPYYPSAYTVGDLLDLIKAYNKSIKRIANEKNVPIVDLGNAFSRLADPKPYFYDTMHANRRGRELIVQEIYSLLEQENLLK